MAGFPAMTSMVTTAAPAMTSMYAQPSPSAFSMYTPAAAAIPTTTTMPAAIPATTVAAPMPVTTAAPSYVAPPVMPAAMPQFATPAPVSLTAGLPDPKTLEAERAAYEKALAAQLDKQSTAVLEEAKIKKAMLEQAAKTQLEQYKLQVDEKYKMACLEVDRERDQVVNGLKEAAIMQQTSLEERVAIAAADYNKKKAIEDMAIKSYQLQQQWYEGEAKLMAQYQAARQAGLQKGVLT